MPHALEQIRRMRGGAQSHLMRCSDGYYYVVKFQNNPQHRRILVNELLGTRLASRLGLPTTPAAIIEVSEELIRLTPELAMEHPRRVENLQDFAGMLVFDKWTCNTNGRQTLFVSGKCAAGEPAGGESNRGSHGGGSAVATETRSGSATRAAGIRSSGKMQPGGSAGAAGDGYSQGESPGAGYRTFMIDQGFCFSAGDWEFPDAPLRGLYSRSRVYGGITGMESFGRWLERLEYGITKAVLDELSHDIPPEWYADDYDQLLKLLGQLFRRRTRVPELLWGAKCSNRQPFPNWV